MFQKRICLRNLSTYLISQNLSTYWNEKKSVYRDSASNNLERCEFPILLQMRDYITYCRKIATSSATEASTSLSGLVKDVNYYRQLWWKTGNIHPKAMWNEATLPYELKTGVSLDEYILKTDKYKVKGLWEWENGTVRVIELPSMFHETCVATIMKFLGASVLPVASTNSDLIFFGATTTKTPQRGSEADGSITPVGKLQVPSGGSDGGNKPWPNLVIEVAYAVTEAELKKKIETYWLAPNRAHDAIGINFNYIPGMRPTEMTAWHYCINNRTAVGALAPIMYEFGTIDRQGNPLNIVPGQCVINIPLRCLYDGMPPTFVIPSPPLPDPISLDLFHVRSWITLSHFYINIQNYGRDYFHAVSLDPNILLTQKTWDGALAFKSVPRDR
ncbi:7504_t:CDS:2 [Ambispora gerdemannii]|uniref:7504_t:CDS:1 n=2 Tax=Glomeromycetes TaxID=214506 RepID=A0A9N9C0U8_9GLOM|nr:7504_t:CDS:2 [Ambispora gerdemannii]